MVKFSRSNIQGVYDRNWSSSFQRRSNISGAFVDIVYSQNICNKYAMEFSILENFGKLYPVLELIVILGLVARMLPQTYVEWYQEKSLRKRVRTAYQAQDD